MSSTVLKGLERLAAAAAFAGGAACLAVFIDLTGLKVGYPFALGLGESPLMQAAMHLADGRIPYRELNSPPYSLVPYGPVYLLLSALLYKMHATLFLGGRLITLGATLAAAAGVYAIVRRQWPSGTRAPAAAAAMLFVAHPYTQQWSVQVNVDMLGVCLSLWTFILLARRVSADQAPSRKEPLLALTAFFTKSSMIAASAAYFAHGLLDRRYRRALSYAAVTGGAAALIYVVLYSVTDGWYYYHTTYEIGRRWVFYQFILFYWWDALKTGPLIVAAPVLLLMWPEARRSAGRMFVAYLGFALALTLSLSKQGSDTNYLLESCALFSVCFGGILSVLALREGATGRLARLAAWALCAGQLWAWAAPNLDLAGIRARYGENARFYGRIAEFVRQADGPVISEDMSLLLRAGKEIFYEPFPMGQMSYSGVWDDTRILRELDNKTFPMVILYCYAPALKRSRTFTERFMKSFNRNYVFVSRVASGAQEQGALYLYRPRQ